MTLKEANAYVEQHHRKKYELTDEEKVVYGVTLHRIRALRNFAAVKKGDLGGWVQGEENLAQ